VFWGFLRLIFADEMRPKRYRMLSIGLCRIFPHARSITSFVRRCVALYGCPMLSPQFVAMSRGWAFASKLIQRDGSIGLSQKVAGNFRHRIDRAQ
jgi:hypothetical protein